MKGKSTLSENVWQNWIDVSYFYFWTESRSSKTMLRLLRISKSRQKPKIKYKISRSQLNIKLLNEWNTFSYILSNSYNNNYNIYKEWTFQIFYLHSICVDGNQNGIISYQFDISGSISGKCRSQLYFKFG